MSREDELIPLGKIRKNLEASPGGRRYAVLVSTGSYCPVHRMHLEMFELAKKCLEEKHDIEVLGGFLSPSHDRYVSSKLGIESIPSSHRLKMCEISVQSSSWLAVSGWEASQDTFVDFPSVTRLHDAVLKRHFPDTFIFVLYLCGADHIIKCRMFYGSNFFGIAAICRPSYSEKMRSIIKVGPQERFYLIDGETEDISSTEIRKRLKSGEPIENLMHPDASKFLLSVTIKKR